MKTVEECHVRWINGPGGFAEFIRDVQNDAIAHARQQCEAEIERLQAELAESRDDTEGWITLATDARSERDEARNEVSRLSADLDIANSDVAHWAKHTVELQSELATLRAQHQPAPVPEPGIADDKRAALHRAIYDAITDIHEWRQLAKSLREWFAENAPHGTNSGPCPTEAGMKLSLNRVKVLANAAREAGITDIDEPPAPAPQEPAESALDKAAREAFERHVQRRVTASEWSRFPSTIIESWRRVVAPFVKDEPPKPVKSDGELLSETGIWFAAWEDIPQEQRDRRDKYAALFLAKRAERDKK